MKKSKVTVTRTAAELAKALEPARRGGPPSLPSCLSSALILLVPFRRHRRRQGIEVLEKRHRRPNLFICNIFPGRIFAKTSFPPEHPGIPHTAARPLCETSALSASLRFLLRSELSTFNC